MSAYRDQIEPALAALRVTSPTSHTWFGRGSRPLSPAVRAALTPARARSFLVAQIARELYGSFYIRGRAVLDDDADGGGGEDGEFVRSLSRANSGHGGWEHGWRLTGTDGERLVLARGGLRVRAEPAECRLEDHEDRGGRRVSVRRPKEHRAISPGHYCALGDAEPPRHEQATELRVYFHIRAAGAAALVAAATGACNASAIGFGLKVLSNPARFWRCDTAVLYLDGRDFERAREPLRAIVAACAAELCDPVPPFCKRVARGVGVGEHRDDASASFGTSRCRLVAQGVAAAGRGASLAELLDAVATSFGDGGLDLDVPYLLAGSDDRYDAL